MRAEFRDDPMVQANSHANLTMEQVHEMSQAFEHQVWIDDPSYIEAVLDDLDEEWNFHDMDRETALKLARAANEQGIKPIELVERLLVTNL